MQRDELLRWFKRRTRREIVAVTSRAALRSVPILASVFEFDLSRPRQKAAILQALRYLISLSVAAAAVNRQDAAIAASKSPDRAGNLANARAASFALSAARHALSAATAPEPQVGADEAQIAVVAARAVSRAEGAISSVLPSDGAGAFWRAVADDCATLEHRHPDVLLETPVWAAIGPPEGFNEVEFRAWGWLNDDCWAFWRDWYKGISHGTPINWGLQREIALIPDADWAKGPEHIADLIAEIEQRHLRNQTPYAIEIEVAVQQKVLIALPVQVENRRLYETALKRVRYMMDQMRTDGVLPQHFGGCARIFRRLDGAYAQFADDPQWMHDEFLLSAQQIGGLVENGEVQGDEDVDALCSSLITASDDIRAADAEVRASVAARMRLRIEEMRVEDTEEAAAKLEVAAEVAVGELHAALADSAKVLRAARGDNPHAPPFGPVDPDDRILAAYRGAALISRMQPKLAELSKLIGDKAEDFDRATKVVAAIRAAGWLIIYFLRLF